MQTIGKVDTGTSGAGWAEYTREQGDHCAVHAGHLESWVNGGGTMCNGVSSGTCRGARLPQGAEPIRVEMEVRLSDAQEKGRAANSP